MPKAHRHSDKRFCGATTVVKNQNSVFVNQLKWAVKDSTNSHMDGQLHASPDQSVTVEQIPVVVHRPENSKPDTLCPTGAPHCNPYTMQGSDNVFAYG